MQKYPHIIDLFSCIRKMLSFIFLFLGNSSINYLISSGVCSTPKLSQLTISFFYKIKQSNVCLRLHIHQDLLYKPYPLIFR